LRVLHGAVRAALLSVLSVACLTACAPQAAPLASTPRPDPSTWAFTGSDVPLDPGFRFGRLANGMRYVLRANANPKGTAQVRLDMDVGSLDETDAEQGYAHFIEHMAFNGSTHVPEGDMIKLLERKGLAFGADTNASTGFEHTIYKLDLPSTSQDMLDTALMLMRETASELTISQGAVDRERGVILSEMRDRNTWAYRETVSSTDFFYPGSRFSERFPIGLTKTLDAATSTNLRAFYKREYVPAHATLIVIGDFDVEKLEAEIKARFSDWTPAPSPPQPGAGPIAPKDKGRTSIYVDPALSERVTVQRNGPWLYEPDSIEERKENLLRSLGYDIINRRLQRLSRQEDPPFRGAGFGTGDVFEAARATRLIVDAVDGKWQPAIEAVAREYRRALDHGFTKAEVAEQVAILRTAFANGAASQDTRTNAQLTAAALALINDRKVPSTPASVLARFEAFAPQITTEAVLSAMKREAIPLRDPLIRFAGRVAPEGGEKALRDAWRKASRERTQEGSANELTSFDYTNFGAPGKVVADTVSPALGIREVRFANGVMLNLRKTDIEKDRVRVSLAIDGGDAIATKKDPLANELVPYLDEGGLGKHSADDLQSILAGHTVGVNFRSNEASYVTRVATTPSDLQLEFDLLAAFVTDPGYRPEGEVQYRQQVNNYFAQLGATPGSALQARLGGILSNDDPRFTLQPVDSYRALTYAELKRDISGRLAHGAIEIGVVGDIDEDAVIAMVARTFGALPQREATFHGTSEAAPRTFTGDRSEHVLYHTGPADQALLRWTWPLTDDSDPELTLQIGLLQRVVQIELTDELREALGKAYSPGAWAALSRQWKGYGTFSINASVDVTDVPAAQKAVAKVLRDMRAAPVSADVLNRARQPMLESLLNALKTNNGWLSLVDRAQTEGDRIDRYLAAPDRLKAITADQIEGLAERYLDPKSGVEVLVLPKGTPTPK